MIFFCYLNVSSAMIAIYVQVYIKNESEPNCFALCVKSHSECDERSNTVWLLRTYILFKLKLKKFLRFQNFNLLCIHSSKSVFISSKEQESI